MKRLLLTGMSGTGKTTLVRELTTRGYKAIDTDYDGWSHWVNLRTGLPAPPPDQGEYGWDELDWVWREERVERLLSTEDSDTLFLAGTAPNQGKFYPHFDHIILLSAPAEIVVERLKSRQNNPYGTTPRSRARVLEHILTVEPLLRRRADHEIDTSAPLEKVLSQIIDIAEDGY